MVESRSISALLRKLNRNLNDIRNSIKEVITFPQSALAKNIEFRSVVSGSRKKLCFYVILIAPATLHGNGSESSLFDINIILNVITINRLKTL